MKELRCFPLPEVVMSQSDFVLPLKPALLLLLRMTS